MRKNKSRVDKYCPFQEIISIIIEKLSEDGEIYDISKKVLIMPSADVKPLDKTVISKILNITKLDKNKGNEKKDNIRSIPKRYYKYMLDEGFKEAFFNNLLDVLDSADEQKESEIVRFIQDGKYTTIFNDGDNSEYIVNALREKLDEELEQQNQHVAFFNSPLRNQPYFFGRQDELDEIKRSLDAHGYAVLSGEPGIGKTEIALNYARDNQTSELYNTIIWAQFRFSIERTFIEILRENSRNTTLADELNAYSIAISNLNHLGKKALVIIDGMNVDFSNITILEEMKRYRFRFIITTRSRLKNAIVVPNLPYVYCKKILEFMNCKPYLIEGAQENFNICFNPFLYALENLNYKQFEEGAQPEFPYIPHEYLGSQRLSYYSWLNKLYAFKVLPNDELHVLKLLSVFSTCSYGDRFIYSICPLCTLERMERLVNLGWIIKVGKGTYDDTMYANAFPWWKVYNISFLDGNVEFSSEVTNIINSFNYNFYQRGMYSDEIHNYALLAYMINSDNQIWDNFRINVAVCVKNYDLNLTYLIQQRSNSALTISAITAKKEWSEYTNSLSDSFKEYIKYAFLCDAESVSKKNNLTINNPSERLENDLVLVKYLAEHYIHNLLFYEIGALDYYQKLIMVIEGYISASNLTEPSEGNIDKIGPILDEIIRIGSRRVEDNLIYKSISSFCNKHNLEMPDIEMIQEFIELMPMIRMIKQVSDLFGCLYMCKCPNEIDGIIMRRIKDLENYGRVKNPKYQAFFYDELAMCCLMRNAPDKAEECLNNADKINQRGISNSDNSFQEFCSIVIRKKIEIFRFIKNASNFEINNNILSHLEQFLNVFSDNVTLKTIAAISLYNFASFFSLGKVGENTINTLFQSAFTYKSELIQAGFADPSFSALPQLNNNNQPSS